jgi:hypothetical protein
MEPICAEDSGRGNLTYTGEAKVTQRANARARIKKKVGGFDVSMNDASSVNIA